MTSSPDRHMQGSSSRRGSESSQFCTTIPFPLDDSPQGPSSMSSESRTSDVKAAASVDRKSTNYICPIPGCSKEFSRPSSLVMHLITHTTSATSLRCQFPDCGREFKNNSHLLHHHRSHALHESSRAQLVQLRQSRRQAQDPDLESVTGGTSGQPQPYPFNDLDYLHLHQDSIAHIPRTRESSISDESEGYKDPRPLTGYHRNDDYRHSRHLPVSPSHSLPIRSRFENEDAPVTFQSRKPRLRSPTHISNVSSPSQSDGTDPLRKRRRISTDSASEPSPSPASRSSSSDNFFNTPNSILSSDYSHSNHSSLDSLYSNFSGIDRPISPLCPSFPASLANSVVHESLYGPFPQNTGNSTTSNAPFDIGPHSPLSSQSHIADIGQGPDSANWTYSFPALPGNTVEKIPPRRYDEIKLSYSCSWPNCTKAYSTLTGLNAHVAMKEHGPKRRFVEFMKMHSQWLKARKEGSYPVGALARQGDNTRFNDPTMYDPACNGDSSSPNAQSSACHNGSNSNGMATTFSNWSNWHSPMATNENYSRPGSAQSGSSSLSDFSQPSLVFPSPSYNRCSSSPNVLSSTSHNGSNSNGMAKKFSNRSNRSSRRASNENRSRPGSAQSGSSGGRSDSP